MSAVIALLLVLTCAGTIEPALAQSPDASDATYTLTWWTVDGGGAGYASGGSITLGGTTGQPDAAAERSGGGYTLRAGFWQPACVAQAVTPAISGAGGLVTLTWTHITANQAYQVHRGTTPYFAASAATLLATVTAAPWSITDPDAASGNPDINHFYLLRAACGAAYDDSPRTGEFDFRLVPGAP